MAWAKVRTDSVGSEGADSVGAEMFCSFSSDIGAGWSSFKSVGARCSSFTNVGAGCSSEMHSTGMEGTIGAVGELVRASGSDAGRQELNGYDGSDSGNSLIISTVISCSSSGIGESAGSNRNDAGSNAAIFGR